MQLSKRLQAVADMVTPGNRVADVGCDHAYTSIYLAEKKVSPHIIAMDVNQGPIDRAKDNIIKYGYADLIEVRKSDGLKELKDGETDTILIAGMGGALTVQILSECPLILTNISEVVLQPQSEIHKVRQMLSERNFVIIEENMLKEDGKYYVMMKATPAKLTERPDRYQLTLREHFHYGKLLLECRHPVLNEFLHWDLDIYREIFKNLTDTCTESSLARQEEIADRIELIQSGLKVFDES